MGMEFILIADGEKYEGHHGKEGKHHGKGIYTWPSGSKYEGDWKDDKKNGCGIIKHGLMEIST